MKKILAFILTFCFTACNAIPVAKSPGESSPTIPEVSPTPSLDPFFLPPNTPTVFPEATLIPITETASSLPPTPIPSATERTNLPMKSGQRVDIVSIQMIDSQNGWGFDSDDHILRTQDDGVNWQDVTPPTGYYSRAGFFALDASTAWVTFSLSLYSNPKTAHVWRTEDGGETWRPSQQFRLDMDVDGIDNPSEYYQPYMMQFIDRQTGWLLVDVYTGMNSTRPLLFQTNDGGETWQVVNDHYHDLNQSVPVGFAFIDEQTGWYGGNYLILKFGMHNIDQIISDGGWHSLMTTDGGQTYAGETLLPITDEFKQPEFAGQTADCGETRMLPIDPQVVGIEWSCQMYTEPQKTIRSFSLTKDGGKTWNSFPASGNEFFLDAQHGWRLSPGQLQQTTDSGLNWITIKTVTWENAQFDFISEREGWVIVTGNNTTALLHTMDGGKTWIEINSVIE